MSAKSKIDDAKRHVEDAISSLRYVKDQNDHYVRMAVSRLEDAKRDLDDARRKVNQLSQSGI